MLKREINCREICKKININCRVNLLKININCGVDLVKMELNCKLKKHGKGSEAHICNRDIPRKIIEKYVCLTKSGKQAF